MDNHTLYQYIRQNGLETREMVALLIGTLVLGCGVYFAKKLLLPSKRHKYLTYNDLLAPFWCVFITSVCFFMVYRGMRARYLLREDASRYTMARVTDHGTRRGYRQFIYHYEVNGKDYQSAEDCGVSQNRALPCPPLGTRFYVQFSSEEPDVEQITQLEVPDSVRIIPPLGWERLPE